jgi:hypothetical protein
MGRSAIIIVIAIVVALFLFARTPSGSSDGQATTTGNGTTTGHLSVVPTIRSVTVSPGSVTFGNCTGGSGATNSSGNTLGYPNGSCQVGSFGVNESVPITVTYTGISGQVYVSGSNADPSDGGTSWTLCSPNTSGNGSPTCGGGDGQPGDNQYTVENFAANVPNAGVLTSDPVCDQEFDQGGGCTASPSEFKDQVQHEGLVLIGPKAWNDHSTSYTLTVTWTAEPPKSSS